MSTQRVSLRAGAPVAAALIALSILAATAGGASAGSMMGKTGDLNMDGRANSLDALQVLVYNAGLMQKPSSDEPVFVAADVNCDLALNALDATLILQHDAGLYNLRP